MLSAVVTGASTGIGRAIALMLAKEGYAVCVNSKVDTEGCQETASLIKETGSTATVVMADVSTLKGVISVFESAPGEPSVLVNNAGRNAAAEFGMWTRAHWEDMLATNLISAALMSQEFVSRIADQSGSIINVSSIRGIERFSNIETAAYSAAKSGVISLTTALSKALAPRVSVNCISPGFVKTAYVKEVGAETSQAWIEGVPIGRFISPGEIADAARFLLHNHALTGANIVIDGGWTLTVK